MFHNDYDNLGSETLSRPHPSVSTGKARDGASLDADQVSIDVKLVVGRLDGFILRPFQ